jgi:hypothetical protein
MYVVPVDANTPRSGGLRTAPSGDDHKLAVRPPRDDGQDARIDRPKIAVQTDQVAASPAVTVAGPRAPNTNHRRGSDPTPGRSPRRSAFDRRSPPKRCRRALASVTRRPNRTTHERPPILPAGILITDGARRRHRRRQSACRLPGVASATPAPVGHAATPGAPPPSPSGQRWPPDAAAAQRAHPVQRRPRYRIRAPGACNADALSCSVRPPCTPRRRTRRAATLPRATPGPGRPIPRAGRGREPPERNAVQRETGARPAPPDPVRRHSATTDTRPRSIPRTDRGREPLERSAIRRETGACPAPPDPAPQHPAATDAPARLIPRASRGREPPERNALQRETGVRRAPPDPAHRHPAATDARARLIPRASRGREPPERNAIQRETGVPPAPPDPAHRCPTTTDARPRPAPRACRGHAPPERDVMQHGTAAACSRTRRDSRRRLRRSPHATWHGGASGRTPGLASTPTDRGNRRTAPLHPHPPHSQCAGQPPHPPPIADDTADATLYLPHPRASAPPRRPDNRPLTTDHW